MAVPKDIILLNHFPFPYAIARYASEVQRALKENSKMVNIKINPTFKNFPAGKTYKGTNSLIANVFLKGFIYKELKQYVESTIKGSGLVHYTEQTMPSFSQGGDREIVTFHDLFALKEKNGPKGLIFRNYTKKFLKFSHAIAISEYTRGEMEGAGFKGDISRIYYGVPDLFHPRANSDRIRQQYGLPINKKLILSISSNAPRKNLPLLKKISKQLDENTKVVRVGPSEGFDFSFQDISDNSLAELYNAVDAFILTSTDEGFNFPVAEAMASGLPVVVSDIEIMKEVTGNAGILCNTRDEASFIEGINLALEENSNYSNLSLKQAEKFTIKKFSKNMNEYYHKFAK